MGVIPKVIASGLSFNIEYKPLRAARKQPAGEKEVIDVYHSKIDTPI